MKENHWNKKKKKKAGRRSGTRGDNREFRYKVIQVATDSAGYQYCWNKKQTFQMIEKLDLETRAPKEAG